MFFLPKGEYFYYYQSMTDIINDLNDFYNSLPGFNLIISNNEDTSIPDGSFYWYCNQVEGSNDMVLSHRDKEGFVERVYLVKIN